MSRYSSFLVTLGVGVVVTAAYFLNKYRNRNKHEEDREEDSKSEIAIEDVKELTLIDLNCFFNKEKEPNDYEAECKKVAAALHHFGICIVRDPRVYEKDNNIFLDMMERYFELSDGLRDARPEYSYQVGVTPTGIEKARNNCALVGAYAADNRPLTPCPPEFDAKVFGIY